MKENENVSALERLKDPEKMQGIQITATVQIPENLEGYHKLVICIPCIFSGSLKRSRALTFSFSFTDTFSLC